MKFGNVVFDDVVEYQRLCKCFFQLTNQQYQPELVDPIDYDDVASVKHWEYVRIFSNTGILLQQGVFTVVDVAWLRDVFHQPPSNVDKLDLIVQTLREKLPKIVGSAKQWRDFFLASDSETAQKKLLSMRAFIPDISSTQSYHSRGLPLTKPISIQDQQPVSIPAPPHVVSRVKSAVSKTSVVAEFLTALDMLAAVAAAAPRFPGVSLFSTASQAGEKHGRDDHNDGTNVSYTSSNEGDKMAL